MAKVSGHTYNDLINALSATVTNGHEASVTTPDEAAITSEEYLETRDYWLTVPATDINNALINLIPYDTNDTNGSNDDVQGYGFNSTIVGGNTGEHFMRYVLSKCTVSNDPIATGDLIKPLDDALAEIESTFGDAEIIIQDNMQTIYESDTSSLQQLINNLTDSNCESLTASDGMSGVFTYGDSNDTNEGEHELAKQTVRCSVVGGGNVVSLFNQINRLCSTQRSSINGSTGRTKAEDASTQFVVGDVLLLSKTSIFKTKLSMTRGTGDTTHPSEGEIATEVVNMALDATKTSAEARANHEWSGFTMGSDQTVFSDGCVFLQVV